MTEDVFVNGRSKIECTNVMVTRALLKTKLRCVSCAGHVLVLTPEKEMDLFIS